MRCNGTKRYAIRCTRETTDPSGLCPSHRHQEWADVRTEGGRWLAENHVESVVIQIPRGGESE